MNQHTTFDGRSLSRRLVEESVADFADTAERHAGLGWTVVLRRPPARTAGSGPEGHFASGFELICCECGDDPGMDYWDVSPEFQRTRGPYLIAAGIAAYREHVALRHGWHLIQRPGQSHPPIGGRHYG
jgi:hypothetical protein